MNVDQHPILLGQKDPWEAEWVWVAALTWEPMATTLGKCPLLSRAQGLRQTFQGAVELSKSCHGAWHPVVWPLPLAQTLPQPCPFLPELSLGSRLWDQSLLLMLEDAVMVACAHGVTVNGA